MLKIALSGKMGCGKNEFLNIVRELFPFNVTEGKFAASIYHCVSLIQDHLDINQEKDGKLLQYLGMHYREMYGQDFWIERFFRNYIKGHIVITDVRFKDELDACKKRGYTLVRIKRQEELRSGSIGNRDINHISETALDEVPDSFFDFTVNNNGDLELLKGAVNIIINDTLRRKR